MKEIDPEDRTTALESVKTVIGRRIDLFGVSESGIKTAVSGQDYRLHSRTTWGYRPPTSPGSYWSRLPKWSLLFLSIYPGKTATDSADSDGFTPTDLTGADLAKLKSLLRPKIAIRLFQSLSKTPVKQNLPNSPKKTLVNLLPFFSMVILLLCPPFKSRLPMEMPRLQANFRLEEAKALAVQLNAGALPVPVRFLSQKNIPATLGADSIKKSITAGAIGLIMVIFFMIGNYGWMGLLPPLAWFFMACLPSLFTN